MPNIFIFHFSPLCSRLASTPRTRQHQSLFLTPQTRSYSCQNTLFFQQVSCMLPLKKGWLVILYLTRVSPKDRTIISHISPPLKVKTLLTVYLFYILLDEIMGKDESTKQRSSKAIPKPFNAVNLPKQERSFVTSHIGEKDI